MQQKEALTPKPIVDSTQEMHQTATIESEARNTTSSSVTMRKSVTLNSGGRRWMEDVMDQIHDLKLTEIAIPGSHDSGCYRMTSPLAAPWTLCQSKTIKGQLELGIRYFDLRFGLFEKDRNDLYYIMHHEWTSRVTLKEVVCHLSDFLHNNTKEIVLLHFTWFAHFRCHDDYVQFYHRLMDTFGTDMFIPQSVLTEKSVGQILNETNHRIAVISEYTNIHDMPLFCPQNMILSNRWFNTPDVNELWLKCDKEVNSEHGKEGFWILQSILSPTGRRPLPVKVLAQSVNKYLLEEKQGWLVGWATCNLNIVMIDYVEDERFVQLIAQMNILRNRKS